MADTSGRLRSQASMWNRRRKRFWRVAKLQHRFNRAMRQPGAPCATAIGRALAMLRPELTDTPLLRIGPDSDGGYLVPDDLEGIEAAFSPGVSSEIGFDLAIAGRGIPCYLADASVEAPADLPANIHFLRRFIGNEDRPPFVTLPSWVAQCAPDSHELMLQMDIEEAEYDVLPTLSEAFLRRFRIIVLELHSLHRLAEPTWLQRFGTVMTRLNAGHVLCHLHANNYADYIRLTGRTVPQVVELSYLRRDRARPTGAEAPIPHPLDRRNARKLPEIPNSAFWRTG